VKYEYRLDFPKIQEIKRKMLHSFKGKTYYITGLSLTGSILMIKILSKFNFQCRRPCSNNKKEN
jgi:hypothetical protein